MNNFLVEKCVSCLKQNVPLFDAMDENERYYKQIKYSVIIRELFRKDFFQEVHNCKLCKVCSILLKGAVVLEKGLFSSQLMYDNHLKTFNANSQRSSSEISNVSVQNQEFRRKYVMIPETTSNVTDSEDVCAETEVQLDVFETDVIDTKDIKLEINETMLNDFNSETTIQIKIETENEIIAESPAVNVKVYNENQQLSNGGKNAGSNGCSGTNAETATDAVDADHHETKASESICQKKSFNCNICNRQFVKKLLFLKHLEAHSDEKPYKCDFCEKEFLRKTHYNSHRRIHSGEKPYKCDLCGKEFRHKSACNEHRRIHTGEKPYKCDLCSMEFSQLSCMSRHKLTHTGEQPHKCDICGKAFARKADVNKHRRIHTGEKPFRCDTCGRAFAHKSHCDTHRRTHTGEKPYKCDLCAKEFTQRSSLNTHHTKVHSTGNAAVLLVKNEPA